MGMRLKDQVGQGSWSLICENGGMEFTCCTAGIGKCWYDPDAELEELLDDVSIMTLRNDNVVRATYHRWEKDGKKIVRKERAWMTIKPHDIEAAISRRPAHEQRLPRPTV